MVERALRRIAGTLSSMMIVGVCVCGVASGQERDFKIGAVHMQEVVEGSPDFQRASEEWTRALTGMTAEIEALQGKLQEAEQLLLVPGGPEGEARSELVRSIDRMRTELDYQREDVQSQLNALRDQLLAPVVDRVRNLVRSYAEENQFDVIIDTSAGEFGMALAVRDVEITDRLLQILREADTGGGPATPPEPLPQPATEPAPNP